MAANSKMILYIGANSAVANPVGGMKHGLQARDRNGAKIVVVDPNYTRTAAKADLYIRIRPGTDIAFVYGMLHLIFKNGWEDKKVIETQSYAIEDIRAEAEKWTPEVTADVTGCDKDLLIQFTQMFATTKPATLIWALGITQHSVGSSNTRILSILHVRPAVACSIHIFRSLRPQSPPCSRGRSQLWARQPAPPPPALPSR